MSKTKMPKEMMIYVFNYEDGKPQFAVAERLDEIPEDCDGNPVGSYSLNRQSSFKVKRELK